MVRARMTFLGLARARTSPSVGFHPPCFHVVAGSSGSIRSRLQGPGEALKNASLRQQQGRPRTFALDKQYLYGLYFNLELDVERLPGPAGGEGWASFPVLPMEETRSRSKIENREPKMDRPRRRYTVSEKVRAAGRRNIHKARAVPKEVLYRRTEKREAAWRANLAKANAVPKRIQYRRTAKRARACYRNLLRALEARKGSQSPSYAPNLRQGLYCIHLRRSAAALGEVWAEFERLAERLRQALPAANEAARRAVRGLAEGMWRRRRVFGGRARLEAIRFYAWLGQAVRQPITSIERMGELARKLTDLFANDWREKVAESFKRSCLHLERLLEAYTEAATGQGVHLERHGVRHRRLAAWLEERPEAVGNPFVGPGRVERGVEEKPSRLKEPGDWGWKVKREGEGAESQGVPYGLIREWERQGFRLPDPRRAEDFALHVRLVEAALGIGDFRLPIADLGSSGQARTGSEQSSIGPARRGQSAIQSPELLEAVRQLAEVTWERLRVFAVQAEREWRQMEERLEGLLAGRLPPPKAEPDARDDLRKILGKPPVVKGPSYEQWATEQVIDPLLLVEEEELWKQASERAELVGGAAVKVIMALEG